jgi:hypothetical protein
MRSLGYEWPASGLTGIDAAGSRGDSPGIEQTRSRIFAVCCLVNIKPRLRPMLGSSNSRTP